MVCVAEEQLGQKDCFHHHYTLANNGGQAMDWHLALPVVEVE